MLFQGEEGAANHTTVNDYVYTVGADTQSLGIDVVNVLARTRVDSVVRPSVGCHAVGALIDWAGGATLRSSQANRRLRQRASSNIVQSQRKFGRYHALVRIEHAAFIGINWLLDKSVVGTSSQFKSANVARWPLWENGTPDDLVKEWVGHSSLRTTSRYTHFTDDFRGRVASEMALFRDAVSPEKLAVSPNGPNFGSVAASEGVA